MKKFTCVLLIVVLALSVIACSNNPITTTTGSNSSNTSSTTKLDELPVLRVATMPFINGLGIKYMIDNEMDKENGFKVDPIFFTMGPPMNESLGADLWDIGPIGGAAVAGVTVYGEVVVGDMLDAIGGISLYVRPDNPIAKVSGYNPSIPELLGNPDTVRGSDIIVAVGSTNQLCQMLWLEKVGLKESDVNIINMDVPTGFQAFLAGEGDIIALGVPFTYKAEEEGWVDVGGFKELGIPITDVLVANPKSLANPEKEELIVKFIRLLFEAQGYLEDDTEMAEDLLMKYMKECGTEISAEDAKRDIARTTFITLEDLEGREHGKFTLMLAEFMAQTGKIEAEKLSIFDTNITDKYIKQILDN